MATCPDVFELDAREQAGNDQAQAVWRQFIRSGGNAYCSINRGRPRFMFRHNKDRAMEARTLLAYCPYAVPSLNFASNFASFFALAGAGIRSLNQNCSAIMGFLPPPSSHWMAHVGEWLSLVEHLVRDQGVGGSNPLSPTILFSDLHPSGENQNRPTWSWLRWSSFRTGMDAALRAYGRGA